MTCINSTAREAAAARIARNLQLLEKAQNTLENTITAEVELYRFDSGDGMQVAKRRKFDDITDLIDRLNGWIRADQEFLNRAGVVSLNLRRKSYGGYNVGLG